MFQINTVTILLFLLQIVISGFISLQHQLVTYLFTATNYFFDVPNHFSRHIGPSFLVVLLQFEKHTFQSTMAPIFSERERIPPFVSKNTVSNSWMTMCWLSKREIGK